MSEITWYTAKNIEGQKKLPKWFRTTGLSDDGVVYIPAAALGDENFVFYSALFDGTSVAIDNERLYINTKWLVQQFPDFANELTSLEQKIKAKAAKQ
jgi:hypothetical protein